MKKMRIDTNVFIPMPMTIVGSMNNGTPNFMAAGWNTRANASPPMIAVGIHRSHLTHDCIMKTKLFSLNIPGDGLMKKTDYTGLVSGRKSDKSGVFDVFFGENPGIPLVADAPLSLECRLVQAVELPSNTLFIGEITAAWCAGDSLSESGSPDYREMRAFFLTMPDNSYWGMGPYLGKAWSVGRDLI